METKTFEQLLKNEVRISNLNDISKMPRKIEVNGETFFFSMWITAWDKFAIGYKTMDYMHNLISAVIEENMEKPYIIEQYTQTIANKKFNTIIFSVKSFEIAFNVLLNAITLFEKEK